jgi:hypothetical protein
MTSFTPMTQMRDVLKPLDGLLGANITHDIILIQ